MKAQIKGKPRLSGLGLRPSGFDPTRRFQHSGLKCSRQIILQEYDFYLVGAASSRDYLSSTMLPWFIAAGSRSHKGRQSS